MKNLHKSAWAEIRTGNLKNNLAVIRSQLPPETAVCAVLKADAYGHGMTGLKMCVTDTNPVICQFCEHCGFSLQGLDRHALIYTELERDKPLARRACQLHFYQQHQKG